MYKPQKSIIMNRRELKECMLIATPPATPLKIVRHKPVEITFTIIPLGRMGVKGYQFIVNASFAIDWTKLEDYITEGVLQDLPLSERLNDEFSV